MATKMTIRTRDNAEPAKTAAHPLSRLPPTANRGTHLVLAASLWSLVGIGLSLSGLSSVFDAGPGLSLGVIVAALLLGYVKAHFVLFKTGSRIVERIERRGDGRSIFGFLSWQSWLMVAGFILLGRALRATPLPEWLLGGIFLAVGFGLLLASQTIWRAWWSTRGQLP